MSLADRKKAVSAVMDVESAKGIRSLTLLDGNGHEAAAVTEAPNGRIVTGPVGLPYNPCAFRVSLGYNEAMRKVRGFTLIELMIVVAIIGVLAAVAIPSFMKYIRRSKTIEATMNLRKMYDGAVAYYVGEHADINGIIANKRFPTTGDFGARPGDRAPPTPTPKYLSQPSEWKQGGWSALDFQVSDGQVFSYEFYNANPTKRASTPRRR